MLMNLFFSFKRPFSNKNYDEASQIFEAYSNTEVLPEGVIKLNLDSYPILEHSIVIK